MSKYLKAYAMTESLNTADHAECMLNHGEPTKEQRKVFKAFNRHIKKRNMCFTEVGIPLDVLPNLVTVGEGLMTVHTNEHSWVILGEIGDVIKEIDSGGIIIMEGLYG